MPQESAAGLRHNRHEMLCRKSRQPVDGISRTRPAAGRRDAGGVASSFMAFNVVVPKRREEGGTSSGQHAAVYDTRVRGIGG